MFAPCYNQIDRVFFKRKENKAISALYGIENIKKHSLLHAHSLFTNGYVALKVKEKHDIPFIVAIRNSDVNSFFAIRPWLRKTGLDIMSQAHSIVFLSPAYRENVLKQYVPEKSRDRIRKKSVVIPNGINKMFLNNIPSIKTKRDGVIRVIQVGEINKNKNQLATVKACELLRNAGQEVMLKIIGKCSDKKYLQKLQSFQFVNYIGSIKQKDLIDHYRNADVFVMPSRHETFGLSYAEAMSQGLPVIYTKNEGFDGFFLEGSIGYSVDASDIREIAQRILNCYENSEMYFMKCIEGSRQFDWEIISKNYLNIYKDMIAGNK